MSLIELKSIKKTYDSGRVQTKVLHGVSLKIEEGDFVSIMGASGSGKSTLMNILGFLDVPTDGSYYLSGKKVTNFDENYLADLRNKTVGFIFQSFYLLPRMSAIDNVQMPMIYAHVNEKKRRERAEKLLKSVGLGHRMDYMPNELSGGEQQRVAIARSLANNPKIILADEPTGNLDSKVSDEIMGIFKELNEKGNTIILVTHNKQVASTAKRIIRIKDGRVLGSKKSKKK